MDIGFEAFKQSRPALTPKRHEIAWGELDFTEQHVYRDHAFEALLQESSLNSIEEPGFKRFAHKFKLWRLRPGVRAILPALLAAMDPKGKVPSRRFP